MHCPNKNRLLFFTAFTLASLTSPTMAQQDEIIEEIVTIGTRSTKPRTVTDSPVPVDVFSGDQFNSLGNGADVTDNLKTLVPSYNATPATGDGSAFVRPTSLRGMAPDQTLVLVNGKRRHRSSLVHFFAPAAGNGAHGPDVGIIPSIAIKSVEVLRDGAASQYGSDAIAGVINFQMKDSDQGGDLQLNYGEYFDGERSTKLATNSGFALGDTGFINLSLELVDNDALSRGIQRPDAPVGVAGVGGDSPFDDAPFVQTWGRPETSATRIFINSGIDVGDTGELYLHSNYGDAEGRYRFFYRNPSHSSLVPFQGLGIPLLQTGYTPFLDGDQTDLSLVTGIKGVFDGGTYYDFSIAYGKNQLDYFLNNTINPDLGIVNGQPAQRDFNVGGYEQKEFNLNADFSSELNDTMNLGYGVEWREETYVINSGEPNSYLGAGSNGLGGFRPADSGSFDRDNYAFYADLEQDISDTWLVQYALRYEDFSDFGSTVNGKVATRININDTTTLRGSISTGFHAPTPGQANVRTTITTFDGATGLQVEEGLVPPTSSLALLAGGAELNEEESFSIGLGLTADIGDSVSVTADLYNTDVNDRIYRTGDITVQQLPAPPTTISFYTNALDVEHSGLDLVATADILWTDDVTTDLTIAYNYNKIKVVDQSLVGGITPVSASTVEDIENNYPNQRLVITGNTLIGENWNFMARANYFGDHYDERGTIGAAASPSAEIGATIYFDMELGYDVNDNLRFVLGVVNVFDEYIDEIGAPNANRLSVGLQYPRRSAANYEGGSWYFKTNYSF